MAFRFLTGSWFSTLPDTHVKIGISRGVPRRMSAGYRLFKKLAPGPWFNSVSPKVYDRLYSDEILRPLNPREVAATITDLARGKIPVMVCYEQPNGTDWCHRAMAAKWLAEFLGEPVPEFGFEHLPQDQHPLMPAELRKGPAPEAGDAPLIQPFIGKEATINGLLHRVVGADPKNAGQAIVEAQGQRFSVSLDGLRRHFS